jgi:hypothetical protein
MSLHQNRLAKSNFILLLRFKIVKELYQEPFKIKEESEYSFLIVRPKTKRRWGNDGADIFYSHCRSFRIFITLPTNWSLPQMRSNMKAVPL